MRKSRFTEQQIMGFLKPAESGLPVKEVCRQGGFSEPSRVRSCCQAFSQGVAMSPIAWRARRQPQQKRAPRVMPCILCSMKGNRICGRLCPWPGFTTINPESDGSVAGSCPSKPVVTVTASAAERSAGPLAELGMSQRD